MAGARRKPYHEFGHEDYMTDDYNNEEYNSYSGGPGANIRTNQQVEHRRKRDGDTIKLHVTNIPTFLTEAGLSNIFNSVNGSGKVVRSFVNSNAAPGRNDSKRWGFVEYRTIREAQAAIAAVHRTPPHNLFVNFALTEDEKQERRRDVENRVMDNRSPTFESPRNSLPPSTRGRGSLPPLCGLSPSSYRSTPRGEDEEEFKMQGPGAGAGYSREQFSHHDTDPAEEASNRVHSALTEDTYDDGKRRMSLGRGVYINGPPKPPQPLIPIEHYHMEEITSDMDAKIAAYLTKKLNELTIEETSAYSSDIKLKLPFKLGGCLMCGRPSIYTCSKCKGWYCCNACRVSDWPEHKLTCFPRSMVFHENGETSYKNVPDVFCQLGKDYRVPETRKSDNFHEDDRNERDLSGRGGNNERDHSGRGGNKSGPPPRERNNKFQNKNRQNNNDRRRSGGDSVFVKPNPGLNPQALKNEEIRLSGGSGGGKRMAGGGGGTTPSKNGPMMNGPKPPIPRNVFTKVLVSSIGKHGNFWGYMAEDNKVQMELVTDLKRCCEEGQPARLQVGGKCAALYGDDWYRAEIVDIYPNNKVKVFFYDFGNESELSSDLLRYLPPALETIPPLAYKYTFAQKEKIDLEEQMPIALMPVTKEQDGSWLVEVERMTYPPHNIDDSAVTFDRYRESENGLDSSLSSNNQENLIPAFPKDVRHALDLLYPEDSGEAALIIERLANEEFLTGTLITNSKLPPHQLVSQVLQKEVEIIENFSGSPGMLVGAEMKDHWARGYVMTVRGQPPEPVVALLDRGRVVVPKRLAPLPDKLKEVPECAVRCIFENIIPFDPQLEGKRVVLMDIKVEKEVIRCSLEGVGSAVLVPWEPAVEEAGLNCVELKTGTRVVISAFHGSHVIYLQSMADKMRDELIQRIARHTMKVEHLKRKPLCGEFLACRFVEDGNFYRAQIFKRQKDRYKVNFVDYGNIELVSVSDMKPLSDELKVIPCLAVKVGLADVPETTLNAAAIKYLNCLAINQNELFLSYDEDLSSVTLTLREGEVVNKVVGELMNPTWKKPDFDPIKGHVFMASELKFEIWDRGDKFPIAIVNMISHDKIMVMRTSSDLLSHIEKTLTPKMTDYCESLSDQTYNPRPSEICLVKFHEDGKWYRAMCVKATQHNASLVVFIDYGNHGEVLHRCIRKMVPEFMDAPVLVKRCKVYGLPDKVFESTLDKLDEFYTDLRTEATVLDDKGDDKTLLWLPALKTESVQLGVLVKEPPQTG